MHQRHLRFVLALSFFAAACLPAGARAADSLSVTFDLADLPSTITLCRDPAAIAAFHVDEQWNIGIDIDNDTTTGLPGLGVDVIFGALTLPQFSGCAPTVADTASSLTTQFSVWDAGSNTFVPSSALISIATDFVAHSITLTTEISGALSGLNDSSKLIASAGGPYQPTMGPPVMAGDSSPPFTLGTALTLPANDVMTCSAPCSPAASWYPLIDLVGMSASNANSQAAFGENTMYVEFDLAALPVNVDLCRYPSALALYQGVSDSQWQAAFNPTGTDTGDGSGGNEIVISAFTTPPSPGCSPSTAPLASSVSAALMQWNSGLQNYLPVGTLPVEVDVANGKIVVQADRSAPQFSGMSANSTISMIAAAVYSNGPAPQAAFDPAIAFQPGGSVTDPTQDVQGCTAPCLTTASWYPEIDLIGGSFRLPDKIFANGFDP